MRLTRLHDGPGGSRESVGLEAVRAQHRRARLVLIAASTGGPSALRELILQLPKQLGAPVVVVQHLPPSFVASFVKQLDRIAEIDVRVAVGGERVEENKVWFAPGNVHLSLVRDSRGELRFETKKAPPVVGCRPAADVLFGAGATECGPDCLAIVLTGMGRDGCEGARKVVAAGGRVIAQDRASSAIWGMPGAVVQAGAASQVLPLDSIADELALAVR